MAVNVKTKAVPKGGRRGGTVFPRVGLEDAIKYAGKLVSKTHTGPQPAGVILPGVFGSSTVAGKIRASALKQYGLMEGRATAYAGTDLAQRIVAAPVGERQGLIQKAFLEPKVFGELHKVFVGDTVTVAKLRQQALALKVHPDSADECVRFFVEGAQHAGLARLEGDSVTIVFASAGETAPEPETGATQQVEPPPEAGGGLGFQTQGAGPGPAAKGVLATRAGVTVSINLDSTFDTEKLERQLEILRKYGVI